MTCNEKNILMVRDMLNPNFIYEHSFIIIIIIIIEKEWYFLNSFFFLLFFTLVISL